MVGLSNLFLFSKVWHSFSVSRLYSITIRFYQVVKDRDCCQVFTKASFLFWRYEDYDYPNPSCLWANMKTPIHFFKDQRRPSESPSIYRGRRQVHVDNNQSIGSLQSVIHLNTIAVDSEVIQNSFC